MTKAASRDRGRRSSSSDRPFSLGPQDKRPQSSRPVQTGARARAEPRGLRRGSASQKSLLSLSPGSLPKPSRVPRKGGYARPCLPRARPHKLPHAPCLCSGCDLRATPSSSRLWLLAGSRSLPVLCQPQALPRVHRTGTVDAVRGFPPWAGALSPQHVSPYEGIDVGREDQALRSFARKFRRAASHFKPHWKPRYLTFPRRSAHRRDSFNAAYGVPF